MLLPNKFGIILKAMNSLSEKCPHPNKFWATGGHLKKQNGCQKGRIFVNLPDFS